MERTNVAGLTICGVIAAGAYLYVQQQQQEEEREQQKQQPEQPEPQPEATTPKGRAGAEAIADAARAGVATTPAAGEAGPFGGGDAGEGLPEPSMFQQHAAKAVAHPAHTQLARTLGTALPAEFFELAFAWLDAQSRYDSLFQSPDRSKMIDDSQDDAAQCKRDLKVKLDAAAVRLGVSDDASYAQARNFARKRWMAYTASSSDSDSDD